MNNAHLYLDFETEAIGDRPHAYPPKPVGYAYKYGGSCKYISWGHQGLNSHTFGKAQALLEKLLASAHSVVCHNTGFDREVCQVHMKLDKATKWHDTMILAFLEDPHGPLGLKPLAVKHLGMPSEEQDAVRHWLEGKGIVRAKQRDWGAHIAEAPASVVGPYAMGDIFRTELLFKKFHRWHTSEAYLRELALTPIITEMEQSGILLDMLRLERDTEQGFKNLEMLDSRIRKILGQVDVDSDAAVAKALQSKGDLKRPLPVTEKGATSVNKKALLECVGNTTLLGHLLMRNSLATCLRTFMQPWLAQGRANKGRLYFRFNQIRNEGAMGSRTGRMSSSPNVMNIPDKWVALMAVLDFIKYRPLFEMPNIRSYIMPDRGCKVMALDYSQQEMRLFAHFEDGPLMRAYQEDPTIDAHEMVAKLSGLQRKAAKTLNFAELYGAGMGVIMQWLDCTHDEAREFKRMYHSALPGVRAVKDSIKAQVEAGKPITTIGGREYMVEDPAYVKGVLRTFEYKLINYLIQGSAADQTKQAIINYHESKGRKGRLMFPVHDELALSVPAKHLKAEEALMREVMTNSFADYLDVPFLVDTEIGDNYGF